MKTLNEYLNEAQDQVFAIVDKDLQGAIMSVWDTNELAENEKKDRLKENPDLKLDIKKMKRSEVENKN